MELENQFVDKRAVDSGRVETHTQVAIDEDAVFAFAISEVPVPVAAVVGNRPVIDPKHLKESYR